MKGEHLLARLRSERRVIGVGAFASPALLAALLVIAAAPVREQPGLRAALTFAVWLTLQGLLPLLAGILAAGLVPGEAAGEALLALPHRYGQIALTRLLLVIGASALGVIGAVCALHSERTAPSTPYTAGGPASLFTAILACLAPLACCCAVGWSAAIVLRSASASRALLALAWTGLLAASAGVGAPDRWAFVQLAYLATGAFAMVIGWLCLRRPEYLFQRTED